MLSPPKQQEIDQRTMKLIVGLIALFLANITSFFTGSKITSISASFYTRWDGTATGWAGIIFVGSLFAISAFLAAYNGLTKSEMILSKFASFFAICIALFPCGCDGNEEVIKHLHGVSAALLFAILAYFCVIFQRRAKAKSHIKAKWRAIIYSLCSIAIVVAISVMAIDFFSGDKLTNIIPRLTFYGERVALVAFGVSWLTASKILPFLADDFERLKFK